MEADGVMDNPFERGAGRNPYLHNLFAILKLLEAPEAPGAKMNNAIITLERAMKVGKQWDVFGYTPTELDIAVAKALQKDANRLTVERLLVHSVHRMDEAQFQEFTEFFESLPVGSAQDMLPLPVVNVQPIARRIPAPQQVSVAVLGRPDVSPLMALLRGDAAQEQILPT